MSWALIGQVAAAVVTLGGLVTYALWANRKTPEQKKEEIDAADAKAAQDFRNTGRPQ